ncbi:MAG: winged helix DNA-binding protein [Clostridia bacterium]|nr:winged helix DNA-binding protein [Clostridia bacterium]
MNQSKAEALYDALTNANTKRLVEAFYEGFNGRYGILHLLSESGGTLSAGEIAEKQQLSTARIAAVLSSLQRGGYVKRSKCCIDGRRTLVTITEKGKAFLPEHKKEVIGRIQQTLSALSDGEQEQFCRLLFQLLA